MNKDDSVWLRIAYICLAFAIGFTASKALEMVGNQTNLGVKYQFYQPLSFFLSALIGVLSVWLFAKDKTRHDYFLSSVSEARKVTWPSAADTRKMTLIVCVVVGLFSVIIAIFDFIWGKILTAIL